MNHERKLMFDPLGFAPAVPRRVTPVAKTHAELVTAYVNQARMNEAAYSSRPQHTRAELPEGATPHFIDRGAASLPDSLRAQVDSLAHDSASAPSSEFDGVVSALQAMLAREGVKPSADGAGRLTGQPLTVPNLGAPASAEVGETAPTASGLGAKAEAQLEQMRKVGNAFHSNSGRDQGVE